MWESILWESTLVESIVMVCAMLIMIMYAHLLGLRSRLMEPSSAVLFTIWRRWVWSRRLRTGSSSGSSWHVEAVSWPRLDRRSWISLPDRSKWFGIKECTECVVFVWKARSIGILSHVLYNKQSLVTHSNKLELTSASSWDEVGCCVRTSSYGSCEHEGEDERSTYGKSSSRSCTSWPGQQE